jgi:uncharacterized membrane protein YjjP (DUF1212 family)
VYPRRRPVGDEQIAGVENAAQISLRIGTLLLAGGAPTEDVEAAIFAVGTALGLQGFEVDITYNSIALSVAPRLGHAGLSDMRVVRGRSTHYARVAAAHQLVLDLADGQVDRQQVEVRLGEVERMRRPFQRWLIVVASGALSAAITVGLGGNALTAAIAFTTASVTWFAGERMTRRKVPAFFVNIVLALSATLVAVGLTAADVKVKSSLVVVGGIISLLPGMSLMVAAQEAIGSFAVTAAARIVELTVSTVGIVAGVLFGLVIAKEFDVQMQVIVGPRGGAGTVTAAVLAAGVASIAASVTYQSPRRLALVAGTVGSLGVLVLAAVEPLITSPGASTAIPAVVIGLASKLIGARLRVPTVLVTVPAIIPLLPGLALYQGLLFVTKNEPTKGIASLVEAVSIALALAAGVLLGQIVGRRPARRVEMRHHGLH